MSRDIEDGLRQAETAFMELAAMATNDLSTNHKENYSAHYRFDSGLHLAVSAGRETVKH